MRESRPGILDMEVYQPQHDSSRSTLHVIRKDFAKRLHPVVECALVKKSEPGITSFAVPKALDDSKPDFANKKRRPERSAFITDQYPALLVRASVKLLVNRW